ncbi:MAG: S-layer protein [Thermoguttaceae bacterium]
MSRSQSERSAEERDGRSRSVAASRKLLPKAILVAALLWLLLPLRTLAATKVYVLAGQSNAVGWGVVSELPPPYNAPQSDVKFWRNGRWVNLQGGFAENSKHFGPELSFGVRLSELSPHDEIYLVKYAIGATSLTKDWNPNGTGPCYNAMKSAVAAAMESLRSQGATPVLAGMIWMQGEQDTLTRAMASAYATNLAHFIKTVRSDFRSPTMPFVLGRIITAYGDAETGPLVRHAEETVPPTVGSAAWIDTDDLKIGAYPKHYGTAGQIALGVRFADKIIEVAKSSASAPTRSNAGVETKTTLVVGFGPFPSAEVAANAEKQVDWLDPKGDKATACTQCFAATEMQKYLRQITGRNDDFRIASDDRVPAGELLLIGGPGSNAVARQVAADLGVKASQLADLGAEGYRIKTATCGGRRVTLVAGATRAGTLYAAYDLLHRMGCRWLGPNDCDEETPHADWRPAFDVTERPSFTSRGFWIYEKRGDPKFWLWMARNRLNEWCALTDQQPFLRKLGFHLCCGEHDAEYRFINPASPYPYKHSRFSGDATKPKPADPYPVSQSYQGDADKDGKLSYFEAHPEWFPMVRGRRVPGIGRCGGTNLCTSNVDALTEFSKNYVEALVDGVYRGADVVNLWALDQGSWCQCPACKKQGIPTDRNLQMVYRLDQQIKQAQREGGLHRPIEIRFLAYMDLSPPPTLPLPKDFDYKTCAATFYPISRCYVHAFDEPTCSRNVDYQKKLYGWVGDPKRHYRGNLVIGEYYNVSRYKSLPLCLMHSMAHDIPLYYDKGARSFQYMHVTTNHWGNKSLTNYQMARQLWDVRTDCNELWQDYFARRYGPAADLMCCYYQSLEPMLSNVEPLKGWSPNLAARLEAGEERLFAESHLRYRREPGVSCDAPTLVEMVEHGRNCRRLIDQAMAMGVPGRIKMRLAEDERIFTYGERTLAYYNECAQAFSLGRAGKKDEARRHFIEAKRIADLLQKDTWSVDLSFIHDEPFPNNAFQATYATRALDHLAKLLGPLPKKSQNPKP